MRNLVSDDHGRQVKFRFKGMNATAIISCRGGYFYLAQDFLASASQLGVARFGHMYTHQIPPNFTLHGLPEVDISHVEFTDTSQILVRRSNSGVSFRKIYKKDGELIYVGTIHKDIEDCNEPSSSVSVMDVQYLNKAGWVSHEKEPSAEEKLARPN